MAENEPQAKRPKNVITKDRFLEVRHLISSVPEERECQNGSMLFNGIIPRPGRNGKRYEALKVNCSLCDASKTCFQITNLVETAELQLQSAIVPQETHPSQPSSPGPKSVDVTPDLCPGNLSVVMKRLDTVESFISELRAANIELRRKLDASIPKEV